MVPLVPVVTTIISGIVHLLLQISLRSGKYVVVYCWIFSEAKQSLAYKNLMNCILILGSGWRGG